MEPSADSVPDSVVRGDRQGEPPLRIAPASGAMDVGSPDSAGHLRPLRLPPAAKYAAIDVGTNSIHLLMVEISPDGDFHVLGRDKEMACLGKGGFARHMLTPHAINQGIRTLGRFLKMARLMGVTRTRAVATSAVREAHNGGDFVRRVADELGLELHVISAEEEARLVYLGVRHVVDLGDRESLILDVGGGSVEMVIGNDREARVLASEKLGASRLAELFVRSDPPRGDEIKAMRKHIEERLAAMFKKAGKPSFERCLVTSGTVGNVAAVCAYRRGATEIEPVTQLTIKGSDLRELLGELADMSRQERSRIPGIDARRVDAILPAVVLLTCVMRQSSVEEFRYCDAALREGVIVDHIARHRDRLLARATWPDARTRSVIRLGQRCAYRQSHAEQVARLGLQLFDGLAPLHGLNGEYRALFRYACLLHDVGYHISHENHHKHSYYLIRNGGLQGFSEQEIEIIANVARYHRKGRPRKSDYSYQHVAKEHRPAVRKLIALLRLANALDRTHYSVVDSVECRVSGDCVDLFVSTNKDAELELWTARRARKFFEKEYGLPVKLMLAGAESDLEESP